MWTGGNSSSSSSDVHGAVELARPDVCALHLAGKVQPTPPYFLPEPCIRVQLDNTRCELCCCGADAESIVKVDGERSIGQWALHPGALASGLLDAKSIGGQCAHDSRHTVGHCLGQLVLHPAPVLVRDDDHACRIVQWRELPR